MSKIMIDANGNPVPLKYVSAYDRARDKAATAAYARFVHARQMLERVVADTLRDLDAVAALKVVRGARGNLTVTSFDGSIRVDIKQQYNIRMDDRVGEARKIMLDFAERLVGRVAGKDGDALLKIVKAAFEGSRDGYLPYAKILSLLKLDITAPEWIKAKQLIVDSITAERGKAYLAVYHRAGRQDDYAPVRLDIADCWPVAAADHPADAALVGGGRRPAAPAGKEVPHALA